jgi:hypothetical protein
MKNRLLFLVLLCSLLSFGQQKNDVVLNWTDGVKTSVGDRAIAIPQFDSQYMDYNADKKELFFIQKFPVATAIRENSVQITNVIYESITPKQLGNLDGAAVPSAVNAVLISFKARNDWYGMLKLSPIVKDGSGYKRIKSFSYSYAFDNPGLTTLGTEDFDVISNSVLASGDWYRFYVEKSGVYKVTKSFLQQLGMNTNTDPRSIKIYGNGGRMVPLLNSTEYPSDLAENAITFIGEDDGQFGDGDYILFYAEGVDNWSRENGTHNNLYADRSYYYVTAQGGAGKRMEAMGQPAGAVTTTTTNFDEYMYHEKDLVNIARLGRKWHGEAFNVNNSQEFEFTVPDIESMPATVIVSAAANAVVSTSMAVKVNGAAVGNISFTPPGDFIGAKENTLTAAFTPSGEDITVSINYNNAGAPGSDAWLDYIIIKAKRKLQGTGRQFRFQYNDAASGLGVIEYQFSNASGIREVWDITDIYNASKIGNEDNQGQFSFRAELGEVRKYITVVPSNYYTPLHDSKPRIANQNIKGTIFNNGNGVFQDVDYIIVTPAFLNSSAERLANLHRTQSGLNVKVVNLENIYQEFSSGKQDIGAIRNLVKYVYNNASSPDKKIKYVNLFGDASFDFKDRIPNNTNVVPILHAYDPNGGINNYSLTATFVSDDFFGLMDPNEGPMTDFRGLDVAVGRMLVNDKPQADEMVNKVMEYLNVESYGRWRNDYIIITDDLDGNGSTQFVPKMETLANDVTENRPFVNIRKIHSDAYVQQASAGGQRYPDAKEQIMRSINYGALVVNYLGHGGEDGMAGERLFETSDAKSLTNRYKYPLFITATCEVTKFDNPYRPTTGEYIYWNPAGGAIAMITTTRAIFISAANELNTTLAQKLYPPGGGVYPSMADALRQTKLTLNSELINCVSFIGDPALKLAVPKTNIVLTEINDVPVGPDADVLNSLAYVKLEGKVTDESGNLLSGYNGELEVTVFDKPISRSTLGNDGITDGANHLIITNFQTLGETIFRGNASVTSGKFEFGFVVPRDIRIPVAEGRISFYAKKNNVLEDQTGYDVNVKIGGVNVNAVADNTGPKVRLYMNDESFVSGGITNESPVLLAFLEDEHGINTASGIGHDIIAILDGDETHPFLLNDYYETQLDNYTKGSVRFPFTNLEKGLHTLTFKAWDVYNNLVSAEIQFVVVGDDNLRLEKVLNYPNPFVSYTEFWFTHNRPFEPLDVQVQIFTVTGKVVRTINQSVTTDGFLCRDIKWDGKDDFGDRIGKGVYVYKLTVRSTTTNKTAEKYEKLVLL